MIFYLLNLPLVRVDMSAASSKVQVTTRLIKNLEQLYGPKGIYPGFTGGFTFSSFLDDDAIDRLTKNKPQEESKTTFMLPVEDRDYIRKEDEKKENNANKPTKSNLQLIIFAGKRHSRPLLHFFQLS